MQYKFVSVSYFMGFFCHKACEILVPQPGIELAPPVLEGRFLTTRLPGKTQEDHFKIRFAVWSLLSLSPPLSLSLPLFHPFLLLFHFSFFLLYYVGGLAPFPSDTVVKAHELPHHLERRVEYLTSLICYLICLPPLSWAHIMDWELSLWPQPQIH